MALLVELGDTRTSQCGVRTRHIQFAPLARVTIRGEIGGSREATVAILECHGGHDIELYFLTLVERMLLYGNEFAGPHTVLDRVAQLIELFGHLIAPPRRSVQGLWAELYAILRAEDAVAALTAWHADPNALHDFVAGDQSVEVKSTSLPIRKHRFALDQLAELEGTRLFVFSVMVHEEPTGASIRDLSDAIAERCAESPVSVSLLERTIAATLGTSWGDAVHVRFSLAYADARTAVYQATDVPTISGQVDSRLSHVAFDANLQDVAPLRSRTLNAAGGLVANLAARTGGRR